MPAKNTPSTHHPRRRNVTTLMVGLKKKRSHTQTSHPKVVKPRDIAGERKKKTKTKQKTKTKKPYPLHHASHYRRFRHPFIRSSHPQRTPPTPTASTASLAYWLRRPPRERKVPGSNPACAGIFSGSSHTSDLKIGTPVATLPGAWRYRVSTGTGRPGVSIL